MAKHTTTAKRPRRRWGTIWEEGDRFRVAWPMGTKRPRGSKSARSYGVADKWLGRIERLVEDGKTEEEIKHAIWGRKIKSRLSFAEIADLYTQRPLRRRKGPEVVEGDHERRRKDSGLVGRLVARAPFAKKQVQAITAPMLVKWQDDMVEEASETTANRYHSKASAICRWAILRDYCRSNPFTLVPKFPEPDRPVDTWLLPTEVQDIHGQYECPVHRGIFVTAVSTGMRKGEVTQFWWEDIRWDEQEFGVIDLPIRITKTDRTRRIPMTADLRAELRRLRLSRGNPPEKSRVFPRGGKTTYDRFKDALDRSTIVPEDKKPKVTFHVLRHTAASLMMQGGAALHEVAEVLGHSTLEVTRRYAHFAPDYAKKPIKRLGRMLNLGIAGRG